MKYNIHLISETFEIETENNDDSFTLKAYKEAVNGSKDTNTIGKDKNKGKLIAVKKIILCVAELESVPNLFIHQNRF